jgi:hypothetical protein
LRKGCVAAKARQNLPHRIRAATYSSISEIDLESGKIARDLVAVQPKPAQCCAAALIATHILPDIAAPSLTAAIHRLFRPEQSPSLILKLNLLAIG